MAADFNTQMKDVREELKHLEAENRDLKNM